MSCKLYFAYNRKMKVYYGNSADGSCMSKRQPVFAYSIKDRIRELKDLYNSNDKRRAIISGHQTSKFVAGPIEYLYYHTKMFLSGIEIIEFDPENMTLSVVVSVEDCRNIFIEEALMKL